MANSYTYRYGQRKVIQGAVDSAEVLEVGDMVFLNTDDVRPASDFTWTSNLATTQANFTDKFLGICMHQSASGDTDPVDVDISADSVYCFTVASATFELGDMLGPDQSGGNTMLDQVLEKAVASSSIAMAMERKASAATSLLVCFASAYNPSSANVDVSIG